MKPNDPLAPFYVWNSAAAWRTKPNDFKIDGNKFEIEMWAKGENTEWIFQRVKVEQHFGPVPRVDVLVSDPASVD